MIRAGNHRRSHDRIDKPFFSRREADVRRALACIVCAARRGTQRSVGDAEWRFRFVRLA
jgi:hypothetical protein